MGALTLPDVIEVEVARVQDATRGLITAAEAGDAEAIQRAIERRGQAVQALRRVLDDNEALLTPRERSAIVERLAHQAQDAAGGLTGLQHRIHEELQALVASARAVRGYRQAPSGESSALDRSG